MLRPERRQEVSGGMSDDLIEKLGELIRNRPWYKLPRLLAMRRLIDIRNDLREQNLDDTEEPPLESNIVPPDLDPALREGRTTDGTHNDLRCPQMGAAGCRFGRNFALEHVFPERANLLIPNPASSAAS